MGYADDIKAAVTMQDVARAYNLRVNRAGFAHCPFHREKTESLKIYKGGRGWHCYGCDKGGDVISFVMEWHNIGFKEACAKLNEDFQIGLPIGEKRTKRQREADAAASWRRNAVHRAKEKAVQAAKSAYDEALYRVVALETIERKLKPKIDDFPGDGWWAAALRMLPIEKYKLELAEIALYEAEHADFSAQT